MIRCFYWFKGICNGCRSSNIDYGAYVFVLCRLVSAHHKVVERQHLSLLLIIFFASLAGSLETMEIYKVDVVHV